MIEFLYKWQTLMGSFIGGIVGLLAALLVAYKERRRDEKASATFLIGELVDFTTMCSFLLQEDHISELPTLLIEGSERLSALAPLTDMFAVSRIRIASTNLQLDSDLLTFEKQHSNLLRLLKDAKKHTVLSFSSKAPQIKETLELIKNHADSANHLLEKLFLRKFVWRKICKTT